MKKRIVSLLTAISMIGVMLTAFTANVSADETKNDFADTQIGEVTEAALSESEVAAQIYSDLDGVFANAQSETSSALEALKADIEMAEGTVDAPAAVTLTDDITGMTTDDIITISADKYITLDMAGHSITVAPEFKGRPFVNEGTLTVTGGGTIDSSDSPLGGYGAINNRGTLTIENGHFAGAKYGDGSAIRNTGSGAVLTVNGGTFDGAPCSIYNEGTATLKGGEFISKSCSSCAAEDGHSGKWSYALRNTTADSKMYVYDGVSVTGTQGAISAAIGYLEVNGGRFETVDCERAHGAIFYALYAAGEYGQVQCVINGGTFIGGKRTAVLIGNDNTSGDGGINAAAISHIYGGTFSAPTGVPALSISPNTANTSMIHGGTYSMLAEAERKYIDPAMEITETENGTTLERSDDANIQVGNRYFINLADAISTANNGDTVTLLADIAAALPSHDGYAYGSAFTIEKDITLDGAGHTITIDTGNWAKFNDKVTGYVFNVGVQDAHRVEGSSNSVTAVIKDLTIKGNSEYMRAGINAYAMRTPDINAGSTNLTLQNVNISDCGTFSLGVNNSNVTVENCNLADGAWKYAVEVDKGATNLKIKSGTIGTVFFGSNSAENIAEITGGTITGVAAVPGDMQKISIYDGIFHSDVNKYVVEGLQAYEDNGIWTIGPATSEEYVARFGNRSYKTLAEAFAALNADKGDEPVTMTILRDCGATANEQLRIERANVVIEGAGSDKTTITLGEFSCSGQAGVLIGANNVTLKNLSVISTAPGGVSAVKATYLGAGEAQLLTGCVLENLNISSEKGHGLNLHGVNDCVVKNVTVSQAGKCGLSIANAKGVTVEGSKLTGTWGDIGMMYGAGAGYENPCELTLGENNTFGKGLIYADPRDDGKENTVTLDAHQIVEIVGIEVVEGEISHVWDDGIVTKEPTCTEKGEKTFACSVDGCEATKTEEVAPLGHTEAIDEAVAATCTTAGKTEGKHCSVCNEVLEAQEEIAPLGHDLAYTAEGNVLTETCKHNCGHSATATITAAGGTVNGENYVANVAYGETWLGDKDIEIIYTNEGREVTSTREVGRYTASITLGEATARVGFRVTSRNTDSNKGGGGGSYRVTAPVNDPNQGGETEIDEPNVPLADAMPFVDVVGEDWFYDSVQYAYLKGMMNGVTETEFAPGISTTRGMITTILYRLEGEPEAGSSEFTDVEDGQYYAKAIAWAAANGIVTGYGDATFGPNDSIVREQMAAILYRYAEYKGYDISARTDLSAYTDAAQISAYAVEAMQWAVAKGLLTGVTEQTLEANGNAVRAQIAAILNRFCENIVPAAE